MTTLLPVRKAPKNGALSYKAATRVPRPSHDKKMPVPQGYKTLWAAKPGMEHQEAPEGYATAMRQHDGNYAYDADMPQRAIDCIAEAQELACAYGKSNDLVHLLQALDKAYCADLLSQHVERFHPIRSYRAERAARIHSRASIIFSALQDAFIDQYDPEDPVAVFLSDVAIRDCVELNKRERAKAAMALASQQELAQRLTQADLTKTCTLRRAWGGHVYEPVTSDAPSRPDPVQEPSNSYAAGS
jgi:hypothetical protein